MAVARRSHRRRCGSAFVNMIQSQNKNPPVWRTCDKAGTPFFLRTQPRVASKIEKQVIVLAFSMCYNNTRIRIQ